LTQRSSWINSHNLKNYITLVKDEGDKQTKDEQKRKNVVKLDINMSPPTKPTQDLDISESIEIKK